MILNASKHWSVDRWGRLIAGASTVFFITLGILHDPLWLAGALMVGVNLVVTTLTDYCPLHDLLIRLGAREREDIFLPGGSPRPENQYLEQAQSSRNA